MRARGDKEREAMKRMRHAIETEEFNNFAIADAVIVNKDLPSSLRQLKAIVGVK
jgi:guanylate kinase